MTTQIVRSVQISVLSTNKARLRDKQGLKREDCPFEKGQEHKSLGEHCRGMRKP